MVGSIVFLTPLAGLVACVALVPLAARVLAGRRERLARETLRLAPPQAARRLPRILALAAVPGLLGVAAMQPALRSQTSARVRTDAQAFYVLDISRSMLASSGPQGRDRLTRAKADALAIRAALPQIPSGVATFSDRVLPALFPDADPAIFDATVERAVSINEPPPTESNVVATTLGALGALGTQNFFPVSATRRLVVVLTDGESRPYNPRAVARDLATRPGVDLILVHVWAKGEEIFDNGRPEQGYHEDPASAEALDSLAQATGGSVVGENGIAAAISTAKHDLGSGPTHVYGETVRTHTLAPYVALLALLPLAAIIRLRAARGIGLALRAELEKGASSTRGRLRARRSGVAARIRVGANSRVP